MFPMHSEFSRRQHQQIQPAELRECPVDGDHLEPQTNGKDGQVGIEPQFRRMRVVDGQNLLGFLHAFSFVGEGEALILQKTAAHVPCLPVD